MTNDIVTDPTEIFIEEDITPRQQQINELRRLVDLLEAQPELTWPYNFGSDKYSSITWYPGGITEAAALQRAIGGRWEKNDPNGSSHDASYLVLSRVLDRELHVRIIVSREKVCTKTVVGTEKKKVRKVVSEAVYEEVYEDVDKVEITCGSLLGAADKEALERLERSS